MRWLAVSVVLSVALTVLVNVWFRAFPGAVDSLTRRLRDLATPGDDARGAGRRVRVWVPWKAMIVASLVLTVAFDLLRVLI